jgi:hypothetical protein
LFGCGSEENASQRFVPARPVRSIVSETVVGTVEGAWGAVQAPFEDINLKQQPIPEKLQRIADNPYAMPSPLQCESLRKEIADLDTLLGPDICTPQNPTGVPPGQSLPPWQVCTLLNPTGTTISRKGEYVEQGAGMARQEAVGIVSGKANIIPFRGVVRRISGAEKHAKQLDRAYQAGKLRRAFLKGLALSRGGECLAPLPALSPPAK